jgi:hypothetical protein
MTCPQVDRQMVDVFLAQFVQTGRLRSVAASTAQYAGG